MILKNKHAFNEKNKENPDNAYSVDVVCANCNQSVQVWIEKGTTKDTVLSNLTCNVCGCKIGG